MVSGVAFDLRLKQLLADLGLSLGEASRRTGLAKATLSRYASARQRPTLSCLRRLCRGLGVTLEYFA